MHWRTMPSYWAIWSKPCEGGSLLEQALKNQVGAAREPQGRNACSTFLIIDAQSVKNADTAGYKGYDVGKKASGIKRYIAVDTHELPHAVAVTTAEVTDCKGALQALEHCKRAIKLVQSVLCDSAYAGEPSAHGVGEVVGAHASVQIARRRELRGLQVMPQRWGGRAQLRVAGEEPQAVEKLRVLA